MGRKKGKQAGGSRSKASRALGERERWANARDDLGSRPLVRHSAPQRARVALQLRPRSAGAAAAAAEPADASPGPAACFVEAPAPDLDATLVSLCAVSVGENFDRYVVDRDLVAAFAVVPPRAIETIACVASAGQLVSDENVELLASGGVSRLVVHGSVGAEALCKLVPRRGEGGLLVGLLQVTHFDIDADRCTFDFVNRLCYALPTLTTLGLGRCASRRDAHRALATCLTELPALVALDVRRSPYYDKVSIRDALAKRAALLFPDLCDAGFEDDKPLTNKADRLAGARGRRPALVLLCDISSVDAFELNKTFDMHRAHVCSGEEANRRRTDGRRPGCAPPP
ncbi:hypothetical protein M885DRAFT_524641 [Pelagophyceae sp. CCMP2097]|nr:hypothetical protein M885DRAFT_524641 [Pelagophyceae sp. CCMP2097]